MSREEADAALVRRLFDSHYDELLRIARRLRGRRGAQTMDTTALVHEAFIRLEDRTGYRDDEHFLKMNAVAIRHVLVDYARLRGRKKRGGNQAQGNIDDLAECLPAADEDLDEILTVAKGLDELARVDPRLQEVVDCRYFAGFTDQETAQILSVTQRTVRRDWTKARALLRVLLADAVDGEPDT